jgi:hypothetical protein
LREPVKGRVTSSDNLAVFWMKSSGIALIASPPRDAVDDRAGAGKADGEELPCAGMTRIRFKGCFSASRMERKAPLADAAKV